MIPTLFDVILCLQGSGKEERLQAHNACRRWVQLQDRENRVPEYVELSDEEFGKQIIQPLAEMFADILNRDIESGRFDEIMLPCTRITWEPTTKGQILFLCDTIAHFPYSFELISKPLFSSSCWRFHSANSFWPFRSHKRQVFRHNASSDSILPAPPTLIPEVYLLRRWKSLLSPR